MNYLLKSFSAKNSKVFLGKANGKLLIPLFLSILMMTGFTSAGQCPTAYAGPDATICQGSSFTVSAATATNYTSLAWTTSGTGSFFNNGTLTPTYTPSANDISNGSADLRLSATKAGCLTAVSIMHLTINPLPSVAGAINGSSTVCQGASGVVYSVSAIANATTYIWSVPVGFNILSGQSTPSIMVSFSTTSASGTISVRGHNACGDGTSSSFPVTVDPLPVMAGTINGPSTVCAGQSGVQFSVASIMNATSYSWSFPAGTTVISGNNTQVITVRFAGTTTSGTILVRGVNSCGDGTDSPPFALTVDPLPGAAGTISGSSDVCQGQAGVNFSVPLITDATGYDWGIPPGANIVAGTNTNSIIVDFSAGASSGNFSVSGTNACGSGVTSASFPVTAELLPSPSGVITGTSIVCQGSTGRIYSVASIPNATGYNWTLPAGATIVAGNNSPTITVNFANTASSGNISVRGTNSCGTGSSSPLFAVTVNPLPGGAGIITGTGTICKGETGVIFSVSPITDATSYTWNLPAGATVTGGANSASITVDFSASASSGDISVSGSNACGTGATSPLFHVTLVPAPVADAGPDAAICQGNSFTVSGATASNYSSLIWTTSGSGTFTNSGTLTPTYFPGAGDISIGSVVLSLTANGNGDCTPAVDQMTLTIAPQAIADAGANASSCGTLPYIITTAIATNYSSLNWTTSGTGSFTNSTTLTPSYTPSSFDLTSGSAILTLNVTGQNPCTGIVTDFMVLQLHQPPVVQAGANATICEGEHYILSDASCSNYQTLLWNTSGSGGFSNPNIPNPTYTPSPADIVAGTVVLTLAATSISPCTGSFNDNMTLTINNVPTVNAGADIVVCQGSPVSLSGTATHYNGVQWTSNGSGVFSTPTTLTTTYTPSLADITAGVVILKLTADPLAPCSGSVEDDLTLTLSSVVLADAGPAQGSCSTAPVNITGASATNYSSLSWSTSGTGMFSNASVINPVYTPSVADAISGSVILTLTANGIMPCTSTVSDNKILTISSPPVVNAGGDITSCAGTNHQISGATASLASTIVWTTSGTGSFSQNGTLTPTYFASPVDLNNGMVTLTITASGAANCSSVNATDDMVLSFSAEPTAYAGPDALICAGNNHTISGASATNYSSLNWTTSGTGNFTGNGTLTPTYFPSANDILSGTVTLILTADPFPPCTNPAVSSMTLTITNLPVAYAGADASICQGSNFNNPDATASNGSTVLWTTSGDGTFINPHIIRPTYVPGTNDIIFGSVVLRLQVTASVPCPGVSTDEITLNIDQSPTANAGPDAGICANSSFTVVAAIASNYQDLLWTSSGTPGTLTNPTTLTPSYNPSPADIFAGSVVLTLTAKAIPSCIADATDQMTIQLTQLPVVDAGPAASICSGSTYTLAASSANHYSSLLWTTSGTGTFTSPGGLHPMYTPSAADIAAGAVTLTLSAIGIPPCNQTETDAMILSIPGLPTVNAGNDGTMCEGPFNVPGASATNFSTVAWTTSGDGIFLNRFSTTPIYTPGPLDLSSGIVTLTLTAIAIPPCPGTVSDNVIYNVVHSPTAFAGLDAQICAGSNYQLINATATNYASLLWTSSGTGFFDNPATLNPTYHPSVTDIANGSVILTLSSNQPSCGSAIDNMTLTIVSEPVANAGLDATICEGTSYTVFSASTTNSSSVLWSSSGTGSLLNPTSLSPTYIPSGTDVSIGQVTLTLTAFSIAPCAGTSVDNMTIFITPGSTASAGPDGLICQGQTFSIIGASATNYSALNWTSGGDGTFVNGNTLFPTYTPGSNDILVGSATLTLTTNGLNPPCAQNATDQMLLTITHEPIVNAGPDASICESTTTFPIAGASAQYSNTVHWISSGTGTFSDPNILLPIYTPSAQDIANGTISLTLTGTGPAGCPVSIQDVMLLHIIKGPQVTAGSNADICETTTYYIDDATASHYSALTWTTSGSGSFTNVTIINPVYTPSVADILAGSVTLTLNANSNLPCTGSVNDAMVLSFSRMPVVNAGGNSSVCQGDAFNINGATVDYSNYVNWTTEGSGSFDNPNLLNATYSPSPADIVNGSVQLKITANAHMPCTGSRSDSLILFITKLPIASAGPDVTICQPSFTITNATASNFLTLQWTSSGTGLLANSNTLTPTYTPSAGDIAAGSVELTLTVEANAPCRSFIIDQMTMTIKPSPVVYAGANALICEGQTYTISDATADNYSGLLWSTSGTGSFANGNTLNPTYTPSPADITSGSVILTLSAQGVAPCMNATTDQLVLTIQSKPVVEAGPTGVICQGSSFSTNGAIVSNAVSTLWTTSGTGTFTNASQLTTDYNPSPLDITNGTVILTLTAINIAPCAGTTSDTRILTITPLAIADAGPNASICANATFTVSGANATNATTINWTSSGTGTFLNGNTLTPAYTPSAADIIVGSVTLTLNASSGAPCIGSSSDAMVLTIDPIADVFAGADASVCENGSYTVMDANAHNYSTINWSTSGTGSFTNGSTLNPVYTPSSDDVTAGSVILTAAVTSILPCVATITDQMVLQVISLPVVEAGTNGTTCGSNSFSITGASATNYSSLVWSTTGSGTFSNITQINPLYFPSAADISAGSVTLRLTANSNSPCLTNPSDTFVLTITPSVTAFAGADASVCENAGYTVNDAVATNYTSLNWTTTGTGTLTGAGTISPTYVPSSSDLVAGNVTLTLHASAIAPCTDIADQMTLTIISMPLVNAGPDAQSCEGSNYSITLASAQFCSSIHWSTSGTGTFSNPNILLPVYIPSVADLALGSALLTLTGQAISPCSGNNVDSFVLTFVPAATANAGLDANICQTGNYTIFGASATNYSSILWTTSGTGGFISGNTLTPTYNPSPADIASGSVILTLHAHGNPPCADGTDNMTLTITHLPVANAGLDVTICDINPYTVGDATANYYSGLNWTSSGTGLLANNATLTPTYTPSAADLASGSVALTLTVMGNPPCNGQDISTKILYLHAGPQANAGPDATICQGNNYTISGASASNYSALNWTTSGSGTFVSNGTLTPTYQPSIGDFTSGSVTLTLISTGTNPCTGTAADIMLLTLISSPTANAGPDASICEGSSYTIGGSSVTHQSNFYWTTSGTGTLTNSTTLTPTYTPSAADILVGSVTLTLTAEGNPPCSANVADQMILTIHALPTANAGTDVTICGSSTYTFSGTAATNYSSINWTTTGSGGFININTLTPTYTPSAADINAGSVVITLTAIGQAPCSTNAADAMVLTIVSQPAVNAGPDATVCATDDYLISGASTSHSTGIAWTTSGDGTFSNVGSVNPTYYPGTTDILNGQAILTITVQPLLPCTLQASDNMLLHINKVPTASAGPDVTICQNGYTISGAAASNYSTLLWSSSGTGILTNASTLTPTYTPSAADIIAGFVTLTITANGIAPCLAQATDAIVLTITVEASANAGPDAIICEGNNYTVSGAAASNFSILTWTHNGNGILTNNGTLTPTYTPDPLDLVSGTVTLTLTATSNAPCSSPATDQMDIQIISLPAVNAGPDASICAGSYMITGSSASHYSTLNWVTTGTGTFNNPSTVNPTYTPSPADIAGGSVVLTMIAASNPPCPGTHSDNMVLNLTPSAAVFAGTDATICGGNSYTINSATASNFTSLTWTSSGSGVFTNGNTLTPTYTPSVTDIAAGTVQLTLTATSNLPCSNISDMMELSIVASPTANAGTDANVCGSNPYTVTGATAGHYSSLSWSFTGSGTMTNAAGLTPTYTPSAGDIMSGSVTLTLTASAIAPCSTNAADAMTIYFHQAPTADAGINGSICQGSNYIINGASAANYSSLNWTTSGSGSFMNNGTLDPTYVPSSGDIMTGTVTLTLHANAIIPCTGDVTDAITLTITRLPMVNAGPDASICQGQSYTVSGSSASNFDSYYWQTSGSGTFANAGTLTPTYNPSAADIAAGSVTLSLVAVAGVPCNTTITDDMILTIHKLPLANAGPDATSCDLSYTISGASASNYGTINWTSSGTGTLTNSHTLTPSYFPSTTDRIAGSVTLTLTVDAIVPCTGNVSDEMVLFLEPLATASAGPDASICEGSNYTLGSATATNYATLGWTTSGTGTFSNATSLMPIYTPSTLDITTGSVILTLTSTSPAPCSQSVSDAMTLTINNLPNVYAGTDASICSGSYYYITDATVSFNSSIYWTTAGSGTFLNGNTISPTYQPSNADIIAGTVVLTLHAGSIAPCSGERTDDLMLTILPSATSNAGGDATICSGSNFTLAGASATQYATLNWTTSGNGTFSNPTILNPIYVPGFNDKLAGFVTLTLHATGISPCNSVVSDDMILTINSNATVNAGPDATSCGTSYTVSNATASNYSTLSWVSSGTGLFTNGNTLSPTYSPSAADFTAGSVILTLTATATGPCTNVATDGMVLTLQAAPTANAGMNSSICQGNSFTVAGSSATNYGTLLWTTAGTGSFANVTTLNPTYTPSAGDIFNGSVILTLTATGSAPCNSIVSDDMVLTISRNATVNAGPDATICAGNTFNVPSAAATNYSSLLWTTSGTGTFMNFTTLTPTYIPSAADITHGSVVLTLIGYNTAPCPGNTNDALLLTISSGVTADAGPNSSVCYPSTFTVSGASANSFQSLNWTSSGTGLLLNAGTLTPSYVPSISDLGAGSVILTLTATGLASCGGTAVDVMTLGIDEMPGNAGIITGASTVCQGQTGVVYSIPPVTDALTYTWNLPAGATITAGNNTRTITVDFGLTSVSGVITVYAVNACGSGAVSQPFAVVVNSLPANPGSIIGQPVACLGSTGINYSITPIPGATGYVWTVPSGSMIAGGAGTPAITVDFGVTAVSGDISVYGTNSCGDGPTSTMAVTIAPMPPVPTITAGGSTSFCEGNSVLLTTAPSGYNYLWSNGATTQSINVTVSGSYSVQISDASGCLSSPSNAIVVTVTASPVVNAGPDTTSCGMAAYTIAGASATSYSSIVWTTSGTGILTNANSIAPTYLPSITDVANGNVMLTLQANAMAPCTGTATDVMVLYFTQPSVVDAGPDASICKGNNFSVTGSNATNFASVNWTTSGSGSFLNGNTLTPTYLPTVADATAGSVILTLNAVNAAPCTGNVSDAMILTIWANPLVEAGSNAMICSGSNYTIFDATASNYASLSWSTSGTGTFTNPAAINPTYNPSAADYTFGSVILTLTALANAPCGNVTDAMTISFTAGPIVDAGPGNSLCPGPNTINGATANNYSTLSWTSSGTGTIINANSITPVYIPSAADITAGFVIMTLTANGIMPCTAVVSDAAVMNIRDLSTANAGPDAIICQTSTFSVTGASATNFTSILWSTSGTGTFLNGTTLTPTYIPSPADITAGSVTLTLTTQNLPCTGATDYMILTIDNQPVVEAGPDGSTCEAAPFSVTGATALNYSSLTWTTSGSGTFTGITTLTPTYYPSAADVASPGGVILTLHANATLPCSGNSSDSFVLHFPHTPVANAGADDSICSGQHYVVTDATAFNYSAVIWTTSGTGTFINPAALNPTYYPSASDITAGFVNLRLIVSNAPCNDAIDTKLLVISTPPVVSAGSDATICTTCSYTISGATASNYNLLQWNTSGNGTFNNSNILNPIYTPGSIDIASGSVTLTLVAQGASACGPVSDNMILTIANVPGVDFTYLRPCLGIPTQFIADTLITNVNSVAVWNWNFGDGYFANTMNPTHTFPATGTYPVTLQITDTSGYSSSITHIITITPPPVSFFGFSSPTCLNNAVQFTDYSHTTGGYISRHVWVYGDATPNDTINFPDDPNVSHTYANDGTYQVTLIITNSSGCVDASSQMVTVIPNPVANFYYSSACSDEQVQFTDGSAANGTNISWDWNFGDPTTGTNNVSTLKNPVHTFEQDGDYLVRLIVLNNNGCSDTMRKLVHVNKSPFANFSFANTCLGNMTEFTDLSNPNAATMLTWDWNFGDGSAHSVQQNPLHHFALPGIFAVTLTVKNSNLCSHDTTFNVTITPKPVAEFQTDSPVCVGSAVNYINLSTTSHGQIIRWEWDFGDGADTTINYPGVPNVTHVFLGSALQHVVRLTVTTTDSCSGYVEHTITSIPSPLANFSFPDTRCKGENMQFTDLSQMGGGTLINNWLWNFDDPLSGIDNISHIKNPVHAFTTARDYYVKLIVYNNSNCTDTITKIVSVSDSPTAAFTADTACLGTVTHFTDQSLAPTGIIVTWNWDFGDGLPHSLLQNPTHLYATAGIYNVTLTVTNINGCSSTVNHTVRVNGAATAAFLYSSGNCSGVPVEFTDQSFTVQGYVVEWVWAFGDGSTTTVAFPNPQNVTHIYADGGIYDVTLTIRTSNGCLGTVVHQVTVYSSPVANFTNGYTRCEGSSVTFTDLSQPNGGGTIMGWNWNFGDPTSGINNNSTLRNPQHIYNTAANYTVTLIVTSVNGCKDTVTKPIDINQIPTALFRADSSCLGNPTHFTDLSTGNSGNITAWSWNFGDGSPSVNVQNPTHIYGAAGVFNVTLTVTNGSGCTSQTTQQVLVTVGPSAYFIHSGACSGDATEFTDQSTVSTGSINNWSWEFGDGATSNLQNPTHVYTQGGTYNVHLTVSSNIGCSSEIILPVVVFASPVASFAYNSSFCPAGRVVFADHSNGSGAAIVSWYWTFGDGFSSTQANPTYTYSNADSTYIVTLVVTNSNGCKDTIIDSTVFVKPGFNFTFHADPVCIGNPMYFQPVNLSGGDSLHDILWNFDDPGSGTYNTSRVYSPEHMFTTPGVYRVNLLAWNSDNCYDSIFKEVTVFPKPVADFTFDSITRCDGIAVFYNRSSGNNSTVDTLVWDFGDGTTLTQSSPVPSEVTHHYAAFGTYDVQMTVINGNGCINTTTKAIQIACISASFTANDTVKCSNTKVTFQDNSSPKDLISKWTWDFGDGSDTTYTHKTPNVVHIYQNTGNYHVTLAIESMSDSIVITATNEMTIHVQHGVMSDFAATSICLGDTARFVNLTDSTYFTLVSSSWDFGEPTSGLGNSSSAYHGGHKYRHPGLYDVQLVMENELGCKDTLIKQVRVYKLPHADFSVPTICSRNSTTFLDLSKQGDTTITSWSWNFGVPSTLTDTSNEQSPSFAYKEDGRYKVLLMVKDSQGCYDTATKTETVLRSPVSAFTLTEDVDGKYGKIQMNNESTNSKLYEWDFGNGEKSSDENPLVTYDNDGDYQIQLVTWASNNCSDTTILEFNFMYHNLFVPNAFSPDNINLDVRYFKPVGINLKLYHIQVFDTWNHLLWESNKLDSKGRPLQGWDGTFNGILMPQGVYMWKISATFSDGKEWEGSDNGKSMGTTMGTVTLIR